jgi:hypothetical protein
MGMADLERDAQPRAQLRAVRLVLGRRVAQAVVDVQRGDRVTAGQADREVEQADRVAPARQQDGDRRARREQAGGAHARLDRRDRAHSRLAHGPRR